MRDFTEVEIYWNTADPQNVGWWVSVIGYEGETRWEDGYEVDGAYDIGGLRKAMEQVERDFGAVVEWAWGTEPLTAVGTVQAEEAHAEADE